MSQCSGSWLAVDMKILFVGYLANANSLEISRFFICEVKIRLRNIGPNCVVGSLSTPQVAKALTRRIGAMRVV